VVGVGGAELEVEAALDVGEGVEKERAAPAWSSSRERSCCYLVMAPEKRLPAWSSMSLCVVIDQPVGNPKRKV
jgi:hypothetical protein